MLVDGVRDAGIHDMEWTALELASGIYIIEMTTDDFRQVRKIAFMK